MPEPSGALVRVRVRACAANRADLLQARGNYPSPLGAPKDIPGLEFAGEVESLGPLVSGAVKVGDRVFGIVGGGGFAEYLVTHERLLAPIPSNLDFIEAAAVPEVFITAHDALETHAKLLPGRSVLIHAVGGGVGSAAVRIAHVMGCFTVGTARSAGKLERAKALGLDVGIDSTRENFAEVVRRETNGKGVHAVIDTLGGPALAQNLDALAPKGRLVAVGLLAGSQANLDMNMLLRKRITIVGTTLRARPLEEKIEATRRFAESVVPWLERGLVKPVVDSVFDLENVREAQERLLSNLGFGKVVLRV